MANQWFKFYGGDYLSDPKIASLTPQERSCWVTLMCLAGLSSKQGVIEYLTIDALLQKSGVMWNPYDTTEWDNATSVLDKLARMKMIYKNEDGTIEILNWEKRQETNLTGAERQARFRAKSPKSNAPRYESNARIEENRIDTSEATASQEQWIDTSSEKEDTEARSKSKPKYPHAKEVFSWFPRAEKGWALNTTELKHAELLFERGEDKVRGALSFAAKHKDDEFCPRILKPSDLERKWLDLDAYAERN